MPGLRPGRVHNKIGPSVLVDEYVKIYITSVSAFLDSWTIVHYELDWVPLVAEPPQWNSTNITQNPLKPKIMEHVDKSYNI